jgi:hypothetical protein
MMSSEKVKCLRACAMIYANILLKGICQVDITPLVMWTAYSLNKYWCIVVHTIVTSLDGRCHICMMVSLQGFTIFGFETILFVLLLEINSTET